MENNVQVFNNVEFGKVRVVEVDGKPWFVAADVAMALGYAKPRNAISAHCKGALKQGVPTNGGVQEATIIPEGDVYRLIIRSKLPSAERFEKWVFDEVLPSIRRTGSYQIKEMSDDEIIGKALMLQTERLRIANQKIAMLAPKAEFFDTVANTDSLLSMGEVAKTLNMGIGRNNLFALLRFKGILSFDNVPYQRFVNAGYFKLTERTYEVNGRTKVATTTYVSQKGLNYIRKVLLKDGYVPKYSVH